MEQAKALNALEVSIYDIIHTLDIPTALYIAKSYYVYLVSTSK